MAKKKDFAAMDKRSSEGAATNALKRRFDDSRVTAFDAEVAELAANPSNPRDPDDPQVQETQGSLQTVGQLQEIRVVPREAYLDAYPDNEETLEPGKWVVVMGNRRLLAARLAGISVLTAKLCPDVGTAQDIEDRIIHENVHRLDLSPLYEADLYRRKMERDGISARELAESVSKSHAYINQRLALLRLIPEFQALIRDGTLGLKDSRPLSKLPPEHQRDVWNAGPPYTGQPAQGGNPVSTTGTSPPSENGGQPQRTPRSAVAEPPAERSFEQQPPASDQVSQDSEDGQDSERLSPPLAPARAAFSSAHDERATITITGTSPAELAQALQNTLDTTALAELIELLRTDH